jgi:saccharopine dehydrogenase-like NADP-dependent oxidoreductase
MRRQAGPSIAVLGGGGAMGRIAVRDLTETADSGIDILIADRDLRAARQVAANLSRPVRVLAADARDPAAIARRLAGTVVIVNACHHDFNLRVMDAALAIGSHYVDLGGLFHVTRRQLRRHAEFRRAGLLALCGMGSAPGIVNVLARAGADRLDQVDEIHVAVGTSVGTARHVTSLLETSYSLQTVLDEASLPAALFSRGTLRFVPPMSHAEAVDFPDPVGRRFPVCTLHSELATLPLSFRRQGVREVSFRIAFPGDLADRLRFIHALGLTSTKSIAVGGSKIVPRDVLLALLSRRPRSDDPGPSDEYEVLRVTLRGRRAGRAVEDVIDCHVPGMPAWGIGVDVDTGAPPSIAAQMIVAGSITARGVVPPERAVPPEPFWRELTRRGMSIRRRTRRVGIRHSTR